VSAAPEPKGCRNCGGEVPPKTHSGGDDRDFCSARCRNVFNGRLSRFTQARGCRHCEHCQKRQAQKTGGEAPAAWVAEAVAELREGRARLQSEFIAFRAEVQALVESLTGDTQGEP
jgi:hypothetical protein